MSHHICLLLLAAYQIYIVIRVICWLGHAVHADNGEQDFKGSSTNHDKWVSPTSSSHHQGPAAWWQCCGVYDNVVSFCHGEPTPMSEPWVEQDALDTYFESAPNTAPDQFSIPEFDTWFHTVTANSINPLDTINTQEPAADDHDHDTSIVDPGHAAATQLQLQEPVTIVIAYCINFQGEVFPIISQHQLSFETSGYSNLHFLGFFMQKIHDVAKPLLVSLLPYIFYSSVVRLLT